MWCKMLRQRSKHFFRADFVRRDFLPPIPSPKPALSTPPSAQVSHFAFLRLAVSDLLCCESHQLLESSHGTCDVRSMADQLQTGDRHSDQTTSSSRSAMVNTLWNGCWEISTETETGTGTAMEANFSCKRNICRALRQVWAMAAEPVWLWNKCRTTRLTSSPGSDRNSCARPLAPVPVEKNCCSCVILSLFISLEVLHCIVLDQVPLRCITLCELCCLKIHDRAVSAFATIFFCTVRYILKWQWMLVRWSFR